MFRYACLSLILILAGCEEDISQSSRQDIPPITIREQVDYPNYKYLVASPRADVFEGNFERAYHNYNSSNIAVSMDTNARVSYELGIVQSALEEYDSARKWFKMCYDFTSEARYKQLCERQMNASNADLAARFHPEGAKEEIRRLFRSEESFSDQPPPPKMTSTSTAPSTDMGTSSRPVASNPAISDAECASPAMQSYCEANIGSECRSLDGQIDRYLASLSVGGASITGPTHGGVNIYDAASASACAQTVGAFANNICSLEFQRNGHWECASCYARQGEIMLEAASISSSIVSKLSASEVERSCGFRRN